MSIDNMPGSPQNTKQMVLIVTVIALSMLLGAGLDRKLELLPMIKQQFAPDSRLTPLEIVSDPNLADYSQIPGNGAPPPGHFTNWQQNTRNMIVETAGSDVIPDHTQFIQYRVLQEKKLESGISRQLIAFKSFDLSEIPAYLHIPPGQGESPAILVIPGHVKEGQSGIEQTAKQEDSYQHAAARQLAEQGFVTLTPELRGFGYLGPPFRTEHTIVAYNALLEGVPYKWITLKDVGYAMSLLRQLESVDAERTGVTGASYGGELAVSYSALDPQVKAVAFHAFGGALGLRRAATGDKRDQPHYCHILPVIDRMVTREQWLWLLAPRPTLGVRGMSNKPFQDSAIAVYQQGWDMAGAQQRPSFISVEGGHEFFVGPAVNFFRKEL